MIFLDCLMSGFASLFLSSLDEFRSWRNLLSRFLGKIIALIGSTVLVTPSIESLGPKLIQIMY